MNKKTILVGAGVIAVAAVGIAAAMKTGGSSVKKFQVGDYIRYKDDPNAFILQVIEIIWEEGLGVWNYNTRWVQNGSSEYGNQPYFETAWWLDLSAFELTTYNPEGGGNGSDYDTILPHAFEIGDIVQFTDATPTYVNIFQVRIEGFVDTNEDRVAESYHMKWWANGTFEQPLFDYRDWSFETLDFYGTKVG